MADRRVASCHVWVYRSVSLDESTQECLYRGGEVFTEVKEGRVQSDLIYILKEITRLFNDGTSYAPYKRKGSISY